MTCHPKDTSINPAIELIANQGFDGLIEAVTLLINEAMKIVRSRHLEAEPYERTEARIGYANGYKPKTVKCRLGELGLSIPQVRDSDFYPSVLEKGLRSERALKAALAEMYIQGVSTRDVSKIIEDLCGLNPAFRKSALSSAFTYARAPASPSPAPSSVPTTWFFFSLRAAESPKTPPSAGIP